MAISLTPGPTLRALVAPSRPSIAPQRLRDRRTAPRRLAARERRSELFAAATFLAVAAAMAVGFADSRPFDPVAAGVLVVAYALVRQAKFDVGVGFAVATQLVLVPMLFLLPADVLPLLVAAGCLLGTLIDIVARGAHPERAIVAVANAWFAVGPALVFVLLGDTEPVFVLCVLAFTAQFATDLASSTAREWLCSSIHPHFQARVIGLIAFVDAMLWPVGLLTAFAAQRDPLLALLVLPLAVLLALVAHERTARLQQVHSQSTRLERATSRIGETFASGLDRDATLALAVDAAIDATEAATGRVTHVRDGHLERRAGGAPEDAALQAAELLALETRGEAAMVGVGGHSALAVALSATAGGEDDEQVVLSVARAAPGFSDEERERFQNLARQAAVSLGNVALHKQLARQATTDELTGLLNHRRLHEALSDELEHGPRFRKPVALVLLDIDDFKRVNDTHGHQCGDEVLYAVARAVESGAREGDHVARYGGEEIAVVLPHAGLAQAKVVAERIRRRIESVAVSLPGGGFVRPTASLGVAVLAGGGDKAALIAAADAALYDAKRAGKNRTVCAGERAGAARRP